MFTIKVHVKKGLITVGLRNSGKANRKTHIQYSRAKKLLNVKYVRIMKSETKNTYTIYTFNTFCSVYSYTSIVFVHCTIHCTVYCPSRREMQLNI